MAGGLVRTRVVEDDVHVEIVGNAVVDRVEELSEFEGRGLRSDLVTQATSASWMFAA